MIRVPHKGSVTTAATLAVVCFATASCTYGPPERFVQLKDYDTPPGSAVTIALRTFSVTRRASGLSAFPDGGKAKELDEGFEINACEKTTGVFRQVAVIHEHPNPDLDLAAPSILEWRDTAVRINRNSGGDTVVSLPRGLYVGSARKVRFSNAVLPECQKSLYALRTSHRMPDGTSETP